MVNARTIFKGYHVITSKYNVLRKNSFGYCHMLYLYRCVFALPIIFLIGCATPFVTAPSEADLQRQREELEAQVQLFQNKWNRQDHIGGLAYPILAANSDLCGSKVVNDIGIRWTTLNDLSETIQRIAAITLGVSQYPYLTVVIPGSPADIAGLRQGDVLSSINGVALREDRKSIWSGHVNGVRYYRWQFNRILKKAERDGSPITIEYHRENELHVTEIQPASRCDYEVFVFEHVKVASYSEGRAILISSGLYEFAQSDRELQTIIGHELAHRIAGHKARVSTGETIARGVDFVLNALDAIGTALSGDPIDENPDSIFSNPNAPKSHRHAHELEADYLGMYLLARAGIDVTENAKFWVRVPNDSPLLYTHTHKEGRMENMTTTLQEISKKMDASVPLDPNLSRTPTKIDGVEIGP